MMKKTLQAMLALAIWISMTGKPASAASNDVYVSPTGNDANTCAFTAPCKTIQKGVNIVQPGGTLHILAGTYSESVTVSKTGTQSAPIRILGEGAVLSNGGSGAFIVNNSQWVTFEGLTIKGYTLMDFEIRQSHYLTFRNNILEYTFAAIRIKDGVSHVLVENNEMYQTYPAGSTWTSLKGSKYEGAGVYASAGGQGMYFIRGNNFHDSMNGFYFSDSDPGQWMNANVFISGNTFRNIVDDPFEPEGDSFNIHFYNNTLINTHRMVSIVPASTCVGPIFVYGNYQHNTIDPTGEANTGRRNSVVKLDMRGGTCPNGVWVFNNTVDANTTGTNFYAVDLLSSSVKNFQLLNNVFVTEKNAYSSAPTFTNASFDFNISLKPFGYTEPHGLQADPLLNSNGTLQINSPAKGRGASVVISNYLASSQIVPTGSDLGAFRSYPSPVYMLPPGGEPADFPANAAGWPDAALPPAPATTTPTVIAVSPTLTNTASPTPILPTSTPTPAALTPTQITAPTETATPLPTSTSEPTLIATSTLTSTPLPFTPTSTSIPSTPTSTASPSSSLGTVYNDKHPAFVYSANWQNVSRAKAYEGSYKMTRKTGSSVTLNFTGQSFSLLYTTGTNFSKMEVYIDNQLVITLDQKTAQLQYQRRWDYAGQLPYGAHELRLVFTGPNDSKVTLDAVVVRP